MSDLTITGTPNAAASALGLTTHPATLDLAVLQIMSLGRPLPVTGWHSDHSYHYVTEDDLLGTYQEDMARAGLWLVVGKPETSRAAVGDSARGNPKWVLQVLVPVTLKHVSGDEQVIWTAGESLDIGDGKALSKAMTDARKTFLRGLFLGSARNAVSDEDGTDAAPPNPKATEKPKKPKSEKPKSEKPAPMPETEPEPKPPKTPPVQWTPEQEATFTRAVGTLGMDMRVVVELSQWHPGAYDGDWRREFYSWLRSDAGRRDYNERAAARKPPLPPVLLGQAELPTPKQGAQNGAGSPA